MQASTDAGSIPPVVAIDPGLEAAPLREAFTRFGRIHIPGFLAEPSAMALHAALSAEREWMCSTMGGGQSIDIPVEQLEALPADQAARLIALAHAEARDGFHYMFDNLRISDRIGKSEPLNPVYRAAFDFLNGPGFLDFVRDLTGDARPARVDAQATRYEAGHYLTDHDDKKPEAGRLYAYVLNLTPRWRTDWGGLLTFIDDDGHVAEAYTPAWNALNLFRVPQSHAVSFVAPFAGASRLSITGWVRSAAPSR
ncbi:2OG-Fe(II) oxygenase family protein [Brevundimonas sp.]|uniref:2OG-Fe(II) oxygenase n=1 Tax=Brevundimonas sp. TaxID=1871086 RepID=UPI0035B450E3